jgi:hypothetical protein
MGGDEMSDAGRTIVIIDSWEILRALVDRGDLLQGERMRVVVRDLPATERLPRFDPKILDAIPASDRQRPARDWHQRLKGRPRKGM